jgi:NNP family nitrate/nitrite transporter-like MFS transporter
MATTATRPAPTRTDVRRPGRWIDDWRPEDPQFWAATGRRTARRNLAWSVFTEHIGFSIWVLWSVFVLFLPPGRYGISADPIHAAGQKFLLTSLPAAVGSAVRVPYTLAVARFGGRNWTVASAVVLLVPCIAAAVMLTPGCSFATLVFLAAVTGVGGGNFASSMTNINAFYPQRLKGRALGLNAGGGNLGVAVVQVVGLVVLSTAGAAHPRYLLAIYIPLVVIGALGAYLAMDNLSQVRNDKGALREVCKDPHTWVMSLLYIGTFGSFIGFGFAFGQVLSTQFGTHFLAAGGKHVDPVRVAWLTFLGPLIGSLLRPVGGWLADRFGGARTTFVNFAGMAVLATVVLAASRAASLPLFMVGFVGLFVLSGVGNGSTYKMIPTIFRTKAQSAVAEGMDPVHADAVARRRSGALIGIAGAIGAFGGVLVNIALRQSFLDSGNGNGAYVAFIAYYLACLALTWFVYLRRSPRRLAGV